MIKNLTSVLSTMVFKSTIIEVEAPLNHQTTLAMVYFVLIGVSMFFGLFYTAAAYFNGHLTRQQPVKA